MNDAEFRDLTERALAIQLLTEHASWPLYVDYITAQIAAKNRWLLQGNAKTLEEYRGTAGWIQGAQACLNAHETLNASLQRAHQEARRRTEAA